MSTEKRRVFFTMIEHPAKGWIRVGNAYGSRKSAVSWLPFVRKAWRGLCRAKVSQCTLRIENDIICEKSKRLLDTKYNLDAPATPEKHEPKQLLRWTTTSHAADPPTQGRDPAGR